jgi:hypothetical protein
MVGKGFVAGRVSWLRVVVLLGVAIGALAAPTGAMALTGPQLLTFGDFPEGTEISTQYEPEGIVFRPEYGLYPEIRWDGSATTNPVLSGTFGFGSRISAQFVNPTTGVPATVENLAMNVGYINEPGSTVVVVERTSGPTSIYANEYGFNYISLAAGDITGFTIESVEDDPAGWTLDNVNYTIPTPPPPPPPAPAPAPAVAPAVPSCPTYAVYDSRGSGEPLGSTSKPGKQFMTGFLQRLQSLKMSNSASVTNNPYPAVGVIGKWQDTVNGLGAVLGVNGLGAYHDSEDQGRREVLSWLKRQLGGACGRASKIVLLGYSQGAQATADAYEQIYAGLSSAQRKQIAAIVLWGDPRYNHDDHLADRDDRITNGLLGTRPPLPNDAKQQKDSKIFSYCNYRDIICQTFPLPEIAYFRAREHELYYTTDEAKNDGSAVASFLGRGGS